MDLKKFNSNLIDPIKLTFDSIIYDQEFEDTIENEVLRQLDKSNSNLIGYFHQNIFIYFSDENTRFSTILFLCKNKKFFIERFVKDLLIRSEITQIGIPNRRPIKRKLIQ